MDTAMWTLLISSALAAIGWLFKTEREKRIAVENQLSDKKYSVYLSIMDLFTDVLNIAAQQGTLNMVAMQLRISDIMKQLIIYGSDPVLKSFSRYRQLARPDEPIHALKLSYDVMLAIRKDMGHGKTEANADDLLGMMISDYAVYREQIMQMK